MPVAVVFIPGTKGMTHVISKDGEFTHLSGKRQVLLRQGTFYVRRSASNHLADSRDLDAVVERRIDQFRAALLDKVTKVVNAPVDSGVYILKRDPGDQEAKRFIIEDSPDAVPIKGMSFTVAPQGPEEEIAAWTVLSADDSNIRPPNTKAWRWFSLREGLKLSATHRLAVFRFSLWAGAPAFWWIKGLPAEQVQAELLKALRSRPPGVEVTGMLVVAAFLGKTFHTKALNALGAYQERVGERHRRYPAQGPRGEYGTIVPGPRQSAEQCKVEQLEKLQALASEVQRANREPGVQERWSAQRRDCYLFAQDDKYRG